MSSNKQSMPLGTTYFSVMLVKHESFRIYTAVPPPRRKQRSDLHTWKSGICISAAPTDSFNQVSVTQIMLGALMWAMSASSSILGSKERAFSRVTTGEGVGLHAVKHFTENATVVYVGLLELFGLSISSHSPLDCVSLSVPYEDYVVALFASASDRD